MTEGSEEDGFVTCHPSDKAEKPGFLQKRIDTQPPKCHQSEPNGRECILATVSSSGATQPSRLETLRSEVAAKT